MSQENIKLMKDMAARYPKLKLTGSKLAGDFYISEQYSIKVDADQTPEDWKVFDSKNGGFLSIEDIKGSDKLIISEFMVIFKEFKVGDGQKAQPKTEIKHPDSSADQKHAPPKKVKFNQKAKSEEYLNRFGMELPIGYPPEMKGQSMKFMQWKKINNVLTSESEVLILDEDDYNYSVHIPSAHIGFSISREKVEIINQVQEGAA